MPLGQHSRQSFHFELGAQRPCPKARRGIASPPPPLAAVGSRSRRFERSLLSFQRPSPGCEPPRRRKNASDSRQRPPSETNRIRYESALEAPVVEGRTSSTASFRR